MKRIYIIFLLILPFLSFAQGENDNWYFGDKAGVNFSSTTPVALTNSNMYALEACGTVSDSSGHLLFYMNGQQIWNRQHQVMPNGTLASIQNDSAQQLAIVKNPANDNQYYIFTTGENSSNYQRIRYSIIDMTLGSIGVNGSPLGDVVQTSKDITVLDNLGNYFSSEAITIIPNSSDQSFWVVIPNGTKLYSYKLSNQGFSNGAPVISNLNFPITFDEGKYFGIKRSPKLNSGNYSHYICISFWGNSQIQYPPASYFINKVYSFNALTGQITNDFSLQVNGLRAYAPEFNKDASVLFLGYENIHAVDLVNSTSSNVLYTQIYTEMDAPLHTGMTLQRNKYGDIYIGKSNNLFLGKVINPDVYGPNMSVNMSAVNLGGKQSLYGLPQLLPMKENSEDSPCVDDLLLITEPNVSYYYEIGNKITTKDRYYLGAKHDITMQSGGSINLLPGTTMDMGSKFYAFIAPCRKPEKLQRNNQFAPKEMFLELDKKERVEMNNNIKISPNPAFDFLNITTSAKINHVEVYDISGKKIDVPVNDTKVDVKHLPAGSYMIMIDTKDGKITKKFIKK
ncbi:T9SS C-terminal target domain-containing protein [Chryseobacterium sp. G0240]|uniref:T9SS type A sorting domain-containing protein n=1 Tax=Chryseobacterium sp. G0240 TaxID=2487066 RepID=UPI000F44EC0E|nr:T9SS type A sorting domain-containing protein [Chryseobacterium sp. G0240]ROI03217.1 T9SS C-terminal target domain-containing protein [Chryseobacterium sp. G0240]